LGGALRAERGGRARHGEPAGIAHGDPDRRWWNGLGLAAVDELRDVALAMRDLAPTTGSTVYEAWVIGSDGVPVPLGAFTVDNSRTAFFEASGLPAAEGSSWRSPLSRPGCDDANAPDHLEGVAAAPG
jgi:hypothetical protein